MDALTALRLQIEWGADEALEAAPLDRLRPVEVRPVPAAAPSEPTLAPAMPATPSMPAGSSTPRGMLVERAAEAAASASTLEALRNVINGFDGLPLRDTATNMVFAEGDAASGLLMIGDAPNADADRAGSLMAGPVGAYLDQMLRSAGIDRSHTMITPLIPWRPPGDRPPSPGEIATCLPFLHRLISIVAPRRLVLLGPLPIRTLLGSAPVRRRDAPTWQKADIPSAHMSIEALSLPSPAILLRTPSQRRNAWAALRLLRRTLDDDLTRN
jgi:DNA polymerase